jgi:LysM domain
VYDRTQHKSNEGLILEGAMSAMPAIELTCGSDVRPVRALRPVGASSGPREVEPGVPGDTPVPQHDALISRRDTPAVRHAAPSPHRDTPPLRLTRRGRVVLAIAAALLVTAVSLLVAGVARATNQGPSPRAARQNLVQVVVHPGQSLWSVAESADPGQDTRAVIQQIIDLNSLNGDTVFAGQQLWVPRG